MSTDAIILTLSIFMGILFLFLFWAARQHKTFDGYIIVRVTDEGKKIFSLELNKDPEEIEKSDVVTFKVLKELTTDFDDYE